MKIATWNVNSLKVRLGLLLDWLEAAKPDVVCLQETKCQDSDFPRLALEAAGWQCAFHGQKTYNGVAILARGEIEDVVVGLPGNPDDLQARYIEGTIDGVRVASIYLPNGNPVATEKYPYKLAWMQRLRHRAQVLLEGEMPLVLAGDYNICPEDEDVYNPAGWREDALCRPESRNLFRAITTLGLTDAIRLFHPGDAHCYTFWDYQQGRWQRDHGLRIDHLLLSPQASDLCVGSGVDRTPRDSEKPSDHTPAWCQLSAPALKGIAAN